MSASWLIVPSCLATALAVWMLRPLAHSFGLTDRPNHRKKHEGEVPLVGGLAIFVGFLIAAILFGMQQEVLGLLGGGAILVVLGAIDDRVELSPSVRLLGQVAAALVMCWLGGVVVRDLGALSFGGETLDLGIFAVPFTVFATVALINSVNMSDGVDGLAGSQTLLSLAGLAVALSLVGGSDSLAPLLTLCGCLTAFLAFNLRNPWRKKASIFLGDSGSNFLGFALAWFLIDSSQGSGAPLMPAAVLWFVTLQVYDTVEIVLRRALRRRSPFGADREHLHHVFLLAGFSVTETVGAMALFNLGGIAVGIVAAVFRPPDALAFFLFAFCGILFLGVILRTWKIMRFLHRSICRRQGGMDRRRLTGATWIGPERRSGFDRRRRSLAGVGAPTPGGAVVTMFDLHHAADDAKAAPRDAQSSR